MPLIVAIEPDRRQADVLAGLARGPLGAELIVADSTRAAVTALGDRIPDLILASLLLSPKDETELGDRLRELDAAGVRVQTLVIPVFASRPRRARAARRSLLTRLRGDRTESTPEGCDPAVFGAQVREYLDRIAAERSVAAAALDDAPFTESSTPELPAPSDQQPETMPPGFEVESEWYPTEPPPLEQDDVSAHHQESGQTSVPEAAAATIQVEPEWPVRPTAEPSADVHQSPEPSLAQQPPDVPHDSRPRHRAVDMSLEGDPDLLAFVAELEREISPSPATGREAADDATRVDELMRFEVPEFDFDLSEFLEEAGVALPSPVEAPASDDSLPEIEIDVPLALEADSDLMEFFAVDVAEPGPGPDAPGRNVEEATAPESPSDQLELPSVDVPEPARAASDHGAPAPPSGADARSSEALPAPQAAETEHTLPERPEWLDLLSAIKRDIEQLRAGLPLPTPLSHPTSHSESPSRKKGRHRRKKEALREEWGFFDPQQTGFSALVSKLDDISSR
jgi:hypothetical protein